MKDTARIDKRILKSKKAIKLSLMEILSQKDIAKITVKEICDNANVNRKTFYNYYDAVNDVIEEIEDDIIAEFDEKIEHIDLNECLRHPELVFSFLVDMVNSDLEFYRNLFKMNESALLLTKLITFIYNKTLESVKPLMNTSDSQTELTCKFVISGIVLVFHDWFMGNTDLSLEEISKNLSLFCFTGVSALNENVNLL